MPRSVADLERFFGSEFVGTESPGLSVAVFHHEGIHWLRGFGVADLRRGEPVGPDTLFRWFSVTKVATATAVLQLAEREHLSLDEPLVRRLHWFRPKGRGAERVTVRNLLSHSGGITNPIPAAWAHPPGVPDRAGEAFARAVFSRNARLRSEPGRATRYTNLGYLLLEALIERTSGQSFRDYLTDRVFAPLGMRDTRVGHDAALRHRLATGHERLLSLRTLGLGAAIPRSPMLVSGVIPPWVALHPFGLDGAGYGSLVGSIRDLVRFGRAHLRGGDLDDARVLERASAESMMLEHAPGFGLAWWRGTDAGRTFVEHGGEGGGYRARLRLYPREGIGFALLANAGAANLSRALERLVDAGWR